MSSQLCQRKPERPFHRALQDRHADFAVLCAAAPWPMLIFGEQGDVLAASDELTEAAGPSCGADTPLRERAQHYLGALRGAQPWRIPQDGDSVRTLANGAVVHECLHLRCTAWGACLSIVDQTSQRQRPVDAQTARLAALGFMVAGVCHEITNPLTSLHSIVQILRAERRPSPELLDKGLNNIAVNVKRILDISRRLVTFSRVGEEPRLRFPVDDAVDEALYVLRHEGLMAEVELQRSADDSALVFGSIGQAREIFLNLLVNAVQAMEGRGRLQVCTRCAGGQVEVLITDDGPGVLPAHRERIFEAFFTTKGETHGTGLGLALSREIALEHGGAIELREAEGRGAAFCVLLPRVRQ